MTDVLRDFDRLYDNLQQSYGFEFYLNCSNRSDNVTTLKSLQDRKSYLCCAVDSADRCVLHKCVIVLLGTKLDTVFRKDDANDGRDVHGTFIIDGRHLSFPNIMMNNNILIHNFYDKLYSKSCKRMFLYGNVDEEKKINRAIQLVYDKHDDVLFARDVYARDYVVTEDLNAILDVYLRKSGKWEPLNFLFEFEPWQSLTIVDQIKQIMRCEINYNIDSLANKIIYKHDYLIDLLYKSVLKLYAESYTNKNPDTADVAYTTIASEETAPRKRRKLQSILYPRECKKIIETIVNGKLIYTVSKTFSKQRKNFINYQDNSSNNNIEIASPLLKYRVGSEVVRITNDTMRQDMLMQQADFVKFVDSFFHGEMTVAGKKFFLCRNVCLPSVDYQAVANKFKRLEACGLISRLQPPRYANNNLSTTLAAASESADITTTAPFSTQCLAATKTSLSTSLSSSSSVLNVSFNNRPTVFKCRRADLSKIFYEFKRKQSAIELKLANGTLFVNHHEGMICIRRTVRVNNVSIATLLTSYEYHNEQSVLKQHEDVGSIQEFDDVTCLMSKLIQYYYKGYTRIFATIPVPKLIVSLTNLKNAMPVLEYKQNGGDDFVDTLPFGNSVVVSSRVRLNNKMFKLWTLVRDNCLMTAEDPYIPDSNLPIRMYNNKVYKLKGKLVGGLHKTETPRVKFVKSETHSWARVDGGNLLHMAGVVVSNAKIGWIYDGKRYKIEACRNKNYHVFKLYFYLRQVNDQKIEKLDASLSICGDTVNVKVVMITSTSDLQGIKFCGLHGQKGVMNGSEDLTEWMAEDGTSAQICLSPISFYSRQSNFNDVEMKYVVRGGDHSDERAKRYPIYNIPYMFFNNTPDNIFKEFIKINHTGHEKIEGTRLDQWTINQSFTGNRWAEGLQCVRGGSNLPDPSGEFNVVSSLLHCNNSIMR